MLSQFFPPIIGGIENHVYNLAAQLAGRGHQVSVATLWQRGLAEREQVADGAVSVYRVHATVQRASRVLFRDPGRGYAPPFPDPELTAGLRRVMEAVRPDIVHAHNWLVYSYLPLKRRFGVPLVATMHDYGMACAKWTLIYRDAACSGPAWAKCLGCGVDTYGPVRGVPVVMGNWAMGAAERRTVDLFLPVSQSVADGNGLPAHGAPYEVMPNFLSDGADDPPLSRDELAPYLAQLPDEPFLLFVGAFGRHKGVDVLLKAYDGLRDAPPLVLIGYETADYALPAPESRVVALKAWPHAAVMAAWRRSLLGVIPSVCPDACPTVALEAMACGRPVVASDIGGLPDLVAADETGVLVRSDDPDALRRGLQRLIGDPAMQSRMGEAALARVTRFEAASVVPRIEAVYGRLVAGADSHV